MIFGIFTLLVALIISGIAAYYSIVGLTAIFSAAVVPIIIMGAALEVGKITAAVWLKLNWHRANLTYKLYLVPAVAVLMLLTSMGIFGFLSKAHSDQNLSTSNADAGIVIIDEKIKVERDNIEVYRRALKQLDEQVDQVMARSKDERGAERSAQIRRTQQRERTKILQDIEVSQKKITQLNEERAPLAAQYRKIESEVGPIKYIAALIYDENPDGTILEKAVRLVIIIIVAVFDPLALVLILAAQQSLRWAKEERSLRRQAAAAIPSVREEPQLDNTVIDNNDNKESLIQEPPVDSFDISKHAYLKKPWVSMRFKDPMPGTLPDPDPTTEIEQPPVPVEVEARDPEQPQVALNRPVEAVDLERGHNRVPVEAAERPNQKKVKSPATELTADNDKILNNKVQAHFGINFPLEPNKGDLYLRVDYLPSRLFKYNGSKWIEVDKNLTDSYVYNEDYIRYLADEIANKRIDIDDLSDSERNQLTLFLENNEQGRNSA